MRRLYTLDQFAKLEEPLQRDSETAISMAALGAPEFVDDSRIVRYTFSTPEVGRDNHTVAPDAWQLGNFLNNPVFLWAHDDTLPPIGRVVEIGNDGKKLKGNVEYAERDLNPFADTIYRMVRAGYINAVSTSWAPMEFAFARDKDRPGGIDFKEVDLLEISQVPIPALPSALAEARSAGIDTAPIRQWAERLLDSAGMVIMPRTELEQIRRAATMKTRRSQATPADTLKTKHDRALKRAPKVPTFKRGLYEVASLCHLLSSVGYCHEAAEYEAALEGDSSEVPEMLGEALTMLGGALKAMTEEEVNELLSAHDPGDEDDGDEEEDLARSLPAKDRAYIAAATSPRARAWRTGIVLARAGHELSPTNEDHLETAQEHHERAMKHHKELGEAHRSVSEHLDTVEEHHERATSTLEELGIHLRAAQQNPAESADHLDKASKKHAEAEKAVGSAAESHQDAEDAHEDAQDSHRCMGRCMKRAQQCVRSVLNGAQTSEADETEADDLAEEEAAQKERAAQERARRERVARALQLQTEPAID